RKSASLTEIEFQLKPTVLLLTPDDCDEHSEVVQLLSRFSERHAGDTVLLDYREDSSGWTLCTYIYSCSDVAEWATVSVDARFQ
ncbi:unnamed protein product, partial [Cylicocyclus nassatus]